MNLTLELIERFTAIVGEKYALRDKQDIEPYLVEPRDKFGGKTSLVLRPAQVEEDFGHSQTGNGNRHRHYSPRRQYRPCGGAGT